MAEMASAALSRWDIDVEACRSGEEALARISVAEFSAVVTDLRMSGMDGIELCAHIVEVLPDIPVLVITAFGSMDTAISAIRAGAYDYLTKPFEMLSLSLALHRAIEHRALRMEIQRLRDKVLLLAQDPLVVEDLPMVMSPSRYASSSVVSDTDFVTDPGKLEPLSQVERRYILRVMKVVDGRRKEASRILGLDRKTLYHKLKSYKVPTDE